MNMHLDMEEVNPIANQRRSLTLRVTNRRRECLDVYSYQLESADGSALPEWQAGAHIDIETPCGLRRQYSLCADPAQRRHWLIAVKRTLDSQGGSRSLHEQLHTGDTISASQPRHAFALQPQPRPCLLLAAGIGITPLLSMAWQLHHEKRPFQLLYFSSSVQHTAFLDTLHDAPFHPHVHIHTGLGRESIKKGIGRSMSELRGAAVYTCGPSGFMALIDDIKQSQQLDMPIYAERFGAPPAVSASHHAFRVRLNRRNGLEIPVTADQSILEALEQHGIAVDSACRQGICGACVQTVTQGAALHKDFCLSPEERDQERLICLCVSRSADPVLTLDL